MAQLHYSFVNEGRTRYNPCVIEYLPCQNLFIVGTYELVEKDSEFTMQFTDLESRNYRVGTLELFDHEIGKSIEVFECQLGGVFDLRVLNNNLDSLGDKQNVNLVAAHANGILALYKIFEHKIFFLKQWKTSSSMLTTVQDCYDDNGLSFIAGGSTGLMSQIHFEPVTSALHNFNLIESTVTDHQHPIWFIRTCRVPLSDSLYNNLLFVGSEDSKWRVFVARSSNKLYENSDSMAGITSFEFVQSKSDFINLLVGSYDEHIRFYRLKYGIDAVRFGTVMIDSVKLLHKIHLTGGGIWRMKAFSSFKQTAKFVVLLSAMFSGAYLLSLTDDMWLSNGDGIHDKKSPTKCENVQQLELPPVYSDKEKLIYGINCDTSLSAILISSFYHKQLYLLRQNKS